MTYLVDTNVLVRYVHKASPMRPAARRALVMLRGRGEELCVVAQNLVEFWAVATRPPAANGLGLTTDEAARVLRRLKRLFVLLPDTPAIFPEWERLVSTHNVAGKLTHDARLVAAMRVHGVANILTFNTDDFKRFNQITAVDPRGI